MAEELEDGTRYSLSTGRVPSLGASNRESGLRPCIISPDDRRYRIWNTFLVTLAVYTVGVAPFEIGFFDYPQAPLSIMDNIVNGFFFVDVILSLFVAYVDAATYLLVDNPKQIFQQNILVLCFDVLSSLPVEFGKIRHSHLAFLITYKMINFARLWRIRRVISLFSRLEKYSKCSYYRVRFAKLIFVTLLNVHFGGCAYYFLAKLNSDPKRTWIGETMESFHQQSLWRRYVISIYWSMTTLSTVGYGDLHAVNSLEMIFVTIYMFINMGLTAYVIGNVTNLVVQDITRTRTLKDALEAATSFARRNQLPPHLQAQMIAHLGLKFRTDSEALQQQVLDAFPKGIRSSISHFLFNCVMDKVYLFTGVSRDLLYQLVSEMKAEYFPPKENVILQNEVPTDFYIVVSGVVKQAYKMGSNVFIIRQDLVVLKEGVEQIVGEATAGHLCGEIGVFCCTAQLFTVRTRQLSQLLRVNSKTFWRIVGTKVGDATIIMNNLFQHMKRLNDPNMDKLSMETETKLARGLIDLPVSLCFASAKGDLLLLRKLFERGLDPNEPDDNGRTALHIATSKGEVDRVLLLLNHRADPNIRDSYGNVPLWEAIRGQHKSVASILFEHGASLQNGDVGQYACTAVEENNINLLDDIISYRGDITFPSDNIGNTALHAAVTENNVAIVKHLLSHGADIDRKNKYGLTPRNLAYELGYPEIKDIFEFHAPLARNFEIGSTS